MKIKDLLYKTPEMTEEKLLEIINNNIDFLIKHPVAKRLKIIPRLKEIYKFYDNSELPQRILSEWDLIQEKKSLLSKSQRDCICGIVSVCLIEMTTNGKSTSNNFLGNIQEIEEIGDVE